MKSMLVIGLGRFGRHLAIKLVELGNQVMIIDKIEERVAKLSPLITKSQIGDCQDEEVVRALGVKNFDVCFVCVSDDFQSSLEITSILKELGAKNIVAKTDREKQAKFLLKIGADDVIHAERDMAQRAAVRYSAKNAFDYIELTPDYAIFEIEVPVDWIGKTVADIKVRSKYSVNIIGIKHSSKIMPFISADYIFARDEHLIISGNKKDSLRLMDKV
ncbi:MAG: potassium channel family protein [Eubacteriales bacterium]